MKQTMLDKVKGGLGTDGRQRTNKQTFVIGRNSGEAPPSVLRHTLTCRCPPPPPLLLLQVQAYTNSSPKLLLMRMEENDDLYDGGLLIRLMVCGHVLLSWLGMPACVYACAHAGKRGGTQHLIAESLADPARMRHAQSPPSPITATPATACPCSAAVDPSCVSALRTWLGVSKAMSDGCASPPPALPLLRHSTPAGCHVPASTPASLDPRIPQPPHPSPPASLAATSLAPRIPQPHSCCSYPPS